MLYQRKIPFADLLSAKLELQLQNGRYASVSTHVVGVCAMTALLWFKVSEIYLMAWAGGMMLLLLLASMRMGYSLEGNRLYNHPFSVYFELIIITLLIGSAWCATTFWIWVSTSADDQSFYAAILIVTLIAVISVSVTVVIRECYLTYLFTMIVPLAAWLAYNYEDRPFNLILSGLLTVLAIVMTVASSWMSRSFTEMVQSNLERAAMAKDLSDLSDSLRQRNSQLEEARKQLSNMATIDELTGLGNRWALNQMLQTELSRAKRSGVPLALVILDVDHFKLYNDTYGHPAGDIALKSIAEILMSVTARAGDMAARMGGEEFLLILPGATAHAAQATAEKIRERLAKLALAHGTSPTASVITLSQGIVSCIPSMATDAEALVAAADEALYQSKDNGRDLITVSPFMP